MPLDLPSPGLEPRIRKWLDALAHVTTGGSGGVSAERVASMASLLAQDAMPSGAYTSRSLHHVAGLHGFFPAYVEVRDAVAGWWEANRPAIAPALAGPDHDGLTAVDRDWVNFYHKRRAETLDPSYRPRRGSVARDLANTLSLLRSQSYPAWAHVTNASKSESVTHPDNVTRAKAAASVAQVELILGQIAKKEAESTPSPTGQVSTEHLDKIRQARISRRDNVR